MRILLNIIFYLCFTQSLWASESIKIAISATPNNLVPFFSTDANSQNINRLVHQSLIDFDEKMEFRCVACESFASKVSGDKHILHFKLRKDLKFMDGSIADATTVDKSIKYFLKNEKIKSTFMDSLENFESLHLISNFEFELIFKKYSLENISNLGLIKILKLNESHLDSLKTDDIQGLGAYQIEKNEPLEIVLKSKHVESPKLIFKVVKDETTLALKLINKEIDLSVASMSARKIDWLSNNYKNILRHEKAGGNYMFMALNQTKTKFKDRNIREAISYLIPRKDLLNYKFKNTVTLSNGMFSQAFPNMFNGKNVDEFNPDLAKKLLKEAGYKLNKHNIFEKDGSEFRIDWKVSNNKSSIEIVEILKNIFQKNGILVDITVLEWGTYMNQFKAGNFDIVMGQWVGFNGPDMLRFVFHSENVPPKGGNRIRYSNPTFDKVIDQAISEPNEDKAIELYRKADKIITDDYAYVSLWHPNIIWLSSNCLHGVSLDSTGAFYSLPSLRKDCHYGK